MGLYCDVQNIWKLESKEKMALQQVLNYDILPLDISSLLLHKLRCPISWGQFRDGDGVHHMNGNISNFGHNKNFGFILGEDNKTYFFHKNDLNNISMFHLQEGDAVEFTPIPSDQYPEKWNAKEVRKRTTSSSSMIQYANPGIHRDFNLKQFNQDEQLIIKAFGKALYATNSGRQLTVASCHYRYFLVKPTEDYVVNFSFQREIPVILSDYEMFEPRSLDVIPYVIKDIPSSLRLDRSCQIIVSRDNTVEEKLRELLKDRALSSVVIPFSYQEFVTGKMTPENILDRFRAYLYDADLFTTSKPIDNDVFFSVVGIMPETSQQSA